jgi:hypothetical protein
MVQAILVWSGAVLGLVVMLVVALGPVIVEVDSWWYERRHGRRLRRARRSRAAAMPDRMPDPMPEPMPDVVSAGRYGAAG